MTELLGEVQNVYACNSLQNETECDHGCKGDVGTDERPDHVDARDDTVHHNSINDDGSGCVVALVESKEISDANATKVTEVWSTFADHLEGLPEAHGFEVFTDWSN